MRITGDDSFHVKPRDAAPEKDSNFKYIRAMYAQETGDNAKDVNVDRVLGWAYQRLGLVDPDGLADPDNDFTGPPFLAQTDQPSDDDTAGELPRPHPRYEKSVRGDTEEGSHVANPHNVTGNDIGGSGRFNPDASRALREAYEDQNGRAPSTDGELYRWIADQLRSQ